MSEYAGLLVAGVFGMVVVAFLAIFAGLNGGQPPKE
jgi:hypothetical protein